MIMSTVPKLRLSDISDPCLHDIMAVINILVIQGS